MASANNQPLFGHNNPMHAQKAVWDKHRSVRFESGEGLATVAYSYKLSHDEMHEAAERIALVWNLMSGFTIDQLRHAVEQKAQTP
jgi:hypothetical protein